MSSEASVSVSNEAVDAAAERSVESELQARREEIAHLISGYIMRVFAAVSITLGGAWLLDPRYPQLLIYAILLLLLALAAWSYPAFQRRHWTSAGLLLVNCISLLVVIIGPALIPSLMPVVGITDVVAMMITIMLLGDRSSRWFVGAFALAYMADIVVVGILGWSPFPPLERTTEAWVTGAVSLVGILTAIVIIRLIVLGLEQQFRRAQRLNLELERRVQEVDETKETLSQERNLLRTLIDTVPANVYIKDTQSRFVDANLETALQVGARTPNDLIGKTDFDFFSPELAGKYFADEQALFRSGLPLHNLEEANFDQRTQRESRFLTTKVPILDEQGTVTGLVGVGLDITAQTHAREQIAQERDLLRTLIDHLPDYIFIKDADGRFVNSNAAHNRIAHVQDAAELWGRTAFDVFPPSLAAQFDADDQRILQTGQALVNVERTSIDAQGGERMVLTTKVPLRDASGKVTGLVGISRDITERKQAEQALRANEEKFKTFFEVLPVGVSVLNSDDQILEANPALERILGISKDGLSSGAYRSRKYVFNDGNRMDPSEFPSARARVEQQVIHDRVVGVIKEDETTVWTSVSAAPLPGANSSVITVTTDITERKRAEQLVLDLRSERERVQVLHQFIGDATHDLMTPITGINMSADLARRAPNRERIIAHLDKIESLSQTLQDRLQDMLTMSQLDMMTSQDLELRTVHLAQLLERLVVTFHPRAEAKEQQLGGEIDPQAGTLQADDLYLAMALAKVIENAIHYTENGGTIQIAIARHQGQVAISIRDTGIGIAQADLAHIFERFYRAENHRPLDAGAGLGLSIAQRIVELHRGRIEVVSVVGSGSTFTILLPGE